MHFNLLADDGGLPRVEIPDRRCQKGQRPSASNCQIRAVARATNDALDALDFMNGRYPNSAGRNSAVPLHETPHCVRDLHRRVGHCAFDNVGEEAALKQLLRGRGGDYEGGADPSQGSLASFYIHGLSVPDTTAGAPMARDLLHGDPTNQQFLDEPQRLMRDEGDVEQMIRDFGDITPYVDPILKSSRRHYLAFCKRMLKAGLCRPSFKMREIVGIFFVWKKGRLKMRVILDARRTNRRFKPSPPVSLLTAEGFASIGIDCDLDIDDIAADYSLAIADVQNCFHYLKIGEEYSEWFCYPYRVGAREVGLTGHIFGG